MPLSRRTVETAGIMWVIPDLVYEGGAKNSRAMLSRSRKDNPDP